MLSALWNRLTDAGSSFTATTNPIVVNGTFAPYIFHNPKRFPDRPYLHADTASDDVESRVVADADAGAPSSLSSSRSRNRKNKHEGSSGSSIRKNSNHKVVESRRQAEPTTAPAAAATHTDHTSKHQINAIRGKPSSPMSSSRAAELGTSHSGGGTTKQAAPVARSVPSSPRSHSGATTAATAATATPTAGHIKSSAIQPHGVKDAPATPKQQHPAESRTSLFRRAATLPPPPPPAPTTPVPPADRYTHKYDGQPDIDFAAMSTAELLRNNNGKGYWKHPFNGEESGNGKGNTKRPTRYHPWAHSDPILSSEYDPFIPAGLFMITSMCIAYFNIFMMAQKGKGKEDDKRKGERKKKEKKSPKSSQTQ